VENNKITKFDLKSGKIISSITLPEIFLIEQISDDSFAYISNDKIGIISPFNHIYPLELEPKITNICGIHYCDFKKRFFVSTNNGTQIFDFNVSLMSISPTLSRRSLNFLSKYNGKSKQKQSGIHYIIEKGILIWTSCAYNKVFYCNMGSDTKEITYSFSSPTQIFESGNNISIYSSGTKDIVNISKRDMNVVAQTPIKEHHPTKYIDMKNNTLYIAGKNIKSIKSQKTNSHNISGEKIWASDKTMWVLNEK
jgi:hypothetical protein